jgi:hypothetical protein
MSPIGTVRNCAAIISAGIALFLAGSSALAGIAAAFALAVLGRGSQAHSYVLYAHVLSCYALSVLPFAIVAMLLGKRRLGLFAIVLGVGAWVFASCLVPMSDTSSR